MRKIYYFLIVGICALGAQKVYVYKQQKRKQDIYKIVQKINEIIRLVDLIIQENEKYSITELSLLKEDLISQKELIIAIDRSHGKLNPKPLYLHLKEITTGLSRLISQ